MVKIFNLYFVSKTTTIIIIIVTVTKKLFSIYKYKVLPYYSKQGREKIMVLATPVLYKINSSYNRTTLLLLPTSHMVINDTYDI
jgi:hypothetical protein